MKISIIGYGHVGKAMKQLFSTAIVYDKFLNIGSRAEVCGSDVALCACLLLWIRKMVNVILLQLKKLWGGWKVNVLW